MKMFLAKPDIKNGGSQVYINFEKALDMIKKIDNITQGEKKIIYLVGWQYNGHDDKFPDLFEVNKALKREQDDTALESLLWLIEEAKKYHTVVSLHINFNDAYEDSPCFGELTANKALIRDADGNPKPIEKYNGKNCYKVSFKEDWESGMFQRRMDKFFAMLPVKEMGTVHVDNFRVYNNISPIVTTQEEIEYRNKMIDYVHELGADITTEYTYREGGEGKDGFCVHEKEYPIHCLGRIPAAWWCSQMTKEELIKISPSQYTGLINDSPAKLYLYGGMHGEDIWLKNGTDDSVWIPKFIKTYALEQIPNDFLVSFRRRAIKGIGLTSRCVFDNGVVSCLFRRTIKQNGKILKSGNTLCLPVSHLKDTYLIYTDMPGMKKYHLPKIRNGKGEVYKVTADGNKYIGKAEIKNGIYRAGLKSDTAYILKIIDR